MDAPIRHLEDHWPEHLEDLKALVRIPSVSFPGFPVEEVGRSAGAVAELLRKRGFENVEILKVGDSHPYVYGDWLHAPGKPTVLLYAHHDVQPPGREEVWKTPPFEPVTQEGPGGLRLYARGAADDKAGVIVHTATVASFLKTHGQLPINVKIVVEGEEEIGSHHLSRFLETYQERLDADVLILTDTANFDCGVPGLTIALRGLVGIDIELRALENTLHSGMWGGPLPDPAMALCRMLSTLVDDRGQIAVPAIRDAIPPLTREEIVSYEALPFDEKDFRRQAGLVEGAELLREGPSPYAQIWRFPSLTVNAIQASSRKQAGNIINDTAWARVTVRVGPGMNSEAVERALTDHLKAHVPWGLQMTLKRDACGSAWSTDPQGPGRAVFELARRAMEKGFARAPVMMGCGGSIPFVQPFADALGGAPALLIGVEDPYTNAHGENESLLIDDLRKACRSQIYLFAELAGMAARQAR